MLDFKIVWNSDAYYVILVENWASCGALVTLAIPWCWLWYIYIACMGFLIVLRIYKYKFNATEYGTSNFNAQKYLQHC